MERREFLRSAVAACATTLLTKRSIQATEARIEILLDEPIATISPNIYGHFIEHLGGVIYDGVWVGEDSKIPNIGGIRAALVEALRRIKPGVVRWPGGCFADSYNWRDGTGPRAQRPRRTNFWIRDTTRDLDRFQVYDPNQFGTHEFISFCKLIGAQPYLAANVRSATPRDFYEWVEYCNAPAGLTTLSKLRATNGSAEPFHVKYWGIGNESWGCGGNYSPEEYAIEFGRFVAWVPQYGERLAFIGSGPNGGDWRWTRGFFTKLAEKRMLGALYGWALHYYCGSTGNRNASVFTNDEWYELLDNAARMESLIVGHWGVMGEIDREHRVKLVVDEWGAWHARWDKMPEEYLWAYPGTLRDALVTGLTLDTFNRHADKVAMANVAQLINTIHSLFLAYEDKFIVTPNFHVFEMYAAHQGAQAVRTLFSAPSIHYTRAGRQAQLWGLSGSASIRDKRLTLTVVNPHASEPRETEVVIRGAEIRSCRARILTADDIHAHNTFDAPRRVEPRDEDVSPNGKTLIYRFAPASVTRLQLDLA